MNEYSELLKELASKDEQIAELKAELLELKVETSDTELDALEAALEIVNDCRGEDGQIDYEKLSEKANRCAEINQYLSVYLLFHDDGEIEIDGENL